MVASDGGEPRNGVDLRQRRETYRGADQALAMAFDMTLTPAIFGFLGYRLDRWVGSVPVFTIGLTLVSLSYVVWKAYVAYEAEMQVHEARLLGRRPGGRADGRTRGPSGPPAKPARADKPGPIALSGEAAEPGAGHTSALPPGGSASPPTAGRAA